MYYQTEDSDRTLESLVGEKNRLNSEIAALRAEKENNNPSHQQTNYEDSYYNMKENNKRVMLEALSKIVLITIGSTVAITVLGSIFITALGPLVLGSALLSAGIAATYSLFEAAKKMRSYDKKNFAGVEYNNQNYMELHSEITKRVARLREIEREIRQREEKSNPTNDHTNGFGQDIQVYPSQVYRQSTRLYRQPQQVTITREGRHI